MIPGIMAAGGIVDGGGVTPLAEIQAAVLHYWDFDEADDASTRTPRLDATRYWSLVEAGSDDVDVATGLRGSGNCARLGGSATAFLTCLNRSTDVVGSTQSFTVAGWVRPRSLGAGFPWTIFRESTSAADASTINLWLGIDNGGTGGSPYNIFAVTRGGSSSDYTESTGQEAAVNDTWVFVQAQRDHANNLMRLRINNGSWTSNATTRSNHTGAGHIMFGALAQDESNYIDQGDIDVQYWGYYDGILSDAALDYLYNSGSGRTSSELSLTPIYDDPFFGEYVVNLLHLDGTDGSTTITDVVGDTWTANGNAQIDTAQSKFGGASLLVDGTGDSVSKAADTDLSFGSGAIDYTIEGWGRVNTLTNNYGSLFANGEATFTTSARGICAFGAAAPIAGQRKKLAIIGNDAGLPVVGTTDLDSIGAFFHWAVCRSNGTTRLFLDGAVENSTAASITMTWGSNGSQLGENIWDGAAGHFDGWIDEVRITRGLARYTGAFTPPSVAFPDS